MVSEYPSQSPDSDWIYKRNFTALVSSMYMGVLGSPDGEWDESCWPDDWTTGLLADDNRAQLLEFGMAMLPGRKVTIRNPLIK